MIDDRKIFIAQYQTCTKDFDYLDFLKKEIKAYFGTALFYTVLVDQFCYFHYQDNYDKFEKLTRYPTLFGNSPSTDRTNFLPRDTFSDFNYSRDKIRMFNTKNVELWTAFNEAKPIMKRKLLNLSKNT